MLSTEEWESQKRARRLQQLALARLRKKELATLDKIAVAQGLPKPSLINKARKTHPLMIDEDGKLIHSFNAKEYFKQQTVSIPLVELLSLSSDYNQATKEALGYSSKTTVVSNNLNSSTSQAGTGIDGAISYKNPRPEALNATQVLSVPNREVYNTDVVENKLNVILTNTFDLIVNQGGVALRVAQVEILDQDYDALLDTGAMISILPMDIVKELNLVDKLFQIKPINLSFAGRKMDSACYVLKDVTLLFSNELEIVHSMLVVDFLNFLLMLGNDFFVGANASLDPKRDELIFDIFSEDDDTEVEKQIMVKS